MPYRLLVAVCLALLLLALRGRLKVALAVLVAEALLVPANLLLPLAPSPTRTVQRLVLVAFMLNLVIRRRRGEIPGECFRIHPVLVVFAGYLAVCFMAGVYLAPLNVASKSAINVWLTTCDQFFTLYAVLIAVRAIRDPVWFAKVLAAVAGLTAMVAMGEHVTGQAWGHLWFAHARSQQGASGGFPLETRGGDVRVRVATEFSLAYAWVAAGLLPLAVAVTVRARRRVALVIPALLAVAVIFTYSRSAYVGVAVGFAALVMLSRFDKRILAFGAIAAFLALPLLVQGTVTQRAFRSAEAAGSTITRDDRLPVVLGTVAQRPFLGVGYSGLVPTQDIFGTDSSYVFIYAEVGVVGVLALGLLALAVISSMLPALRAPPGPLRTIGAASLVGALLGLAGAAVFDQFSDLQSARPFWMLVALGLAVAESVERRPLGASSRRLVVWTVAGVAAGMVIWIAAPRHDAEVFRFASRPAAADAVEGNPNPEFVNTMMRRTACAILLAEAHRLGHVSVYCASVHDSPSVGEARIAVRAGDDLLGRAQRLQQATAALVPTFAPLPVQISRGARPTVATTAPVWLGAAGLGLALVVPRRRRGGAAGVGPDEAGLGLPNRLFEVET